MSHNKDNTLAQLSKLAQDAQSRSYSPYSNFKVGAALVDDTGATFSGCNVENASYPLGQCAEASAISAMINGGGKTITEILIASPTDEYCPPCGGCRQKIREFAGEHTQVHMLNQKGDVKTLPLADLLPLAFDKQDL